MSRKNQTFVFKSFIIENGEKKEIDPFKFPELADRIKLEWAKVVTGKEYVLVK